MQQVIQVECHIRVQSHQVSQKWKEKNKKLPLEKQINNQNNISNQQCGKFDIKMTKKQFLEVGGAMSCW